MFEIRGKYNTAKVFANEVGNKTISQITELCNQQWLEECNITIQADTHAGKGCTIGTTIKLKDKVSPSLVGVDISCGMLVIQIPRELKLNLEKIDKFINENIPAGFEVNEALQYNEPELNSLLTSLHCYENLKNVDHIKKACGSLGSGNHFIELNKDDEGNHYLVVHTGSRNLGKQVAEIYQDIADEHCNKAKENKERERQELINKLKREGKQKEIQKELERFQKEYKEIKKIPHDLCYLEGQDMKNYLEDTHICNEYAKMSRVSIAQRILEFIVEDNFSSLPDGSEQLEDLNVWIDEIQENHFEFGYENRFIDVRSDGFQTLHNYIGKDNVLRKGAVSAQKGETVIIPINMRDGSIIAIGKGNAEYNCSGPHGAGRLLSRSEAKEQINMEDFKETMKNIYSSSVGTSTLDEAPMAYKPIESIIENIQDTVEIKKIIKPIYNFKAH
mgnify:CR=1 FL=1